MRSVLASLVLAAASTAFAEVPTIPMYDLPLKNGAPGELYKMSEHPNSVFVFEAYRLSCGYCNSNAKNLDKLAEDYKDNPRVQVLDLGLDSTEAAFQEWVQKHNPNHPVVQDVGYRIYKAFRSQNAIPQVFIANCKGELVGSVIGEWNADQEAEVRGHIEEALKADCTGR